MVSPLDNLQDQITGFDKWIEELEAAGKTASDIIEAQAARIAELEEVITNILIGCNHLALLIGPDHPPYETDPFDALEHYGSGDTYEIWCCWRSIMLARAAIKATQP